MELEVFVSNECAAVPFAALLFQFTSKNYPLNRNCRYVIRFNDTNSMLMEKIFNEKSLKHSSAKRLIVEPYIFCTPLNEQMLAVHGSV